MLDWIPVAAIIISVAGFVAPLYLLLLRMRREDGISEEKISQIAEKQNDLDDSMGEVENTVRELRHDVETNIRRAERNQRHIHQLLVGTHNADDDEDIGNPHYRSEYCPLPDECPFHDSDERRE